MISFKVPDKVDVVLFATDGGTKELITITSIIIMLYLIILYFNYFLVLLLYFSLLYILFGKWG